MSEKLPPGLSWARVKGGHRLHILDLDALAGGIQALCGHRCGTARWGAGGGRMKDRTGWWAYGDERPYRMAGQGGVCEKCEELARAGKRRRIPLA